MSLLKIGQSVWIKGKEDQYGPGCIRFIGQIKSNTGQWIGIELDRPYGDQDAGFLDGIRYFHTKPCHGLLIKMEDIITLPRSKLNQDQQMQSPPYPPNLSFPFESTSPPSIPPSPPTMSSSYLSSPIQSPALFIDAIQEKFNILVQMVEDQMETLVTELELTSIDKEMAEENCKFLTHQLEQLKSNPNADLVEMSSDPNHRNLEQTETNIAQIQPRGELLGSDSSQVVLMDHPKPSVIPSSSSPHSITCPNSTHSSPSNSPFSAQCELLRMMFDQLKVIILDKTSDLGPSPNSKLSFFFDSSLDPLSDHQSSSALNDLDRVGSLISEIEELKAEKDRLQLALEDQVDQLNQITLELQLSNQLSEEFELAYSSLKYKLQTQLELLQIQNVDLKNQVESQTIVMKQEELRRLTMEKTIKNQQSMLHDMVQEFDSRSSTITPSPNNPPINSSHQLQSDQAMEENWRWKITQRVNQIRGIALAQTQDQIRCYQLFLTPLPSLKPLWNLVDIAFLLKSLETKARSIINYLVEDLDPYGAFDALKIKSNLLAHSTSDQSLGLVQMSSIPCHLIDWLIQVWEQVILLQFNASQLSHITFNSVGHLSIERCLKLVQLNWKPLFDGDQTMDFLLDALIQDIFFQRYDQRLKGNECRISIEATIDAQWLIWLDQLQISSSRLAHWIEDLDRSSSPTPNDLYLQHCHDVDLDNHTINPNIASSLDDDHVGEGLGHVDEIGIIEPVDSFGNEIYLYHLISMLSILAQIVHIEANQIIRLIDPSQHNVQRCQGKDLQKQSLLNDAPSPWRDHLFLSEIQHLILLLNQWLKLAQLTPSGQLHLATTRLLKGKGKAQGIKASSIQPSFSSDALDLDPIFFWIRFIRSMLRAFSMFKLQVSSSLNFVTVTNLMPSQERDQEMETRKPKTVTNVSWLEKFQPFKLQIQSDLHQWRRPKSSSWIYDPHKDEGNLDEDEDEEKRSILCTEAWMEMIHWLENVQDHPLDPSTVDHRRHDDNLDSIHSRLEPIISTWMGELETPAMLKHQVDHLSKRLAYCRQQIVSLNEQLETMQLKLAKKEDQFHFQAQLDHVSSNPSITINLSDSSTTELEQSSISPIRIQFEKVDHLIDREVASFSSSPIDSNPSLSQASPPSFTSTLNHLQGQVNYLERGMQYWKKKAALLKIQSIGDQIQQLSPLSMPFLTMTSSFHNLVQIYSLSTSPFVEISPLSTSSLAQRIPDDQIESRINLEPSSDHGNDPPKLNLSQRIDGVEGMLNQLFDQLLDPNLDTSMINTLLTNQCQWSSILRRQLSTLVDIHYQWMLSPLVVDLAHPRWTPTQQLELDHFVQYRLKRAAERWRVIFLKYHLLFGDPTNRVHTDFSNFPSPSFLVQLNASSNLDHI